MLKKIFPIVLAILFIASAVQVQAQGLNEKFSLGSFKSKKLNEDLLQRSVPVLKTHFAPAATKKNSAVSLLLSFVLPGAGHFYADRMDVGGYFLGAEAALWLGYGGFTYYANSLQSDSRSFASVHSGLDKNGKPDDYFSNVGNYMSVYDYNNEKLSRGEYDLLYDVGSYYWNWDSQSNQGEFESQRRKSERTYNNRVIFVTGLIVNRIVSGISALVLTNRGNSKITSGLRINTSFTGTPDNHIDGIQLNFSKSF
ncbi:MAG: hypothetical protein NTV87_05020 [Ignavibacteriae bacterium]|nr:hypothetical protein [Ignavibacteriota bacterium]